MVASNSSRRVDLVLTATDNASGTVAKIGQNVQKMARDVASASRNRAPDEVFGPAVKNRFGNFEQEARDQVAGRLRAMRDAAKRANVQERASEILFGPKEKAATSLKALTDAEGNIGRFTGRTSGGGGVNAEGFLRNFKSSTEGLETFSKFLKGAAAFAIIREAGQALQKIPENARLYDEALANGHGSAVAAALAIEQSVPLWGEVGKGVRAVRDFVGDRFLFPLKKIAADLEAQADENKATRDTIRQGRDQKRAPINREVAETDQGARDRLRTIGLSGDALGREEAQIALDAEMRRINTLRSQRGALGPDEQKKLDESTGRAEQAARAGFQAKLSEIDKSANDKAFTASTEANARLKAAQDSQRQEELQAQGRFFDAKIEGIRTAADQEIAERAKERDELQKGLKPADFKFKLADQSFTDAKTQIEAGRDQQIKTATAANQRDIERDEADHQSRIRDVRVAAAEERLRFTGDNAGAERLALEREYEKQLDDIKRNLDEQIQAHKEREPELRRFAIEDAQAATESFQSRSKSLERSEADRFRPTRTPGIEGESRLLTGILGTSSFERALQGGNNKETTAEQQKTTKAVEKNNDTAKKAADYLQQILTELRKPGLTLITVGAAP